MGTIAELVFDEYPDDVISVRLSPIPMGTYLQIIRDMNGADTDAKWEAAMSRFAAAALVSWTFPEPANWEGMQARDLALNKAIYNQWVERVGAVAPPLPRQSSSTGPSPARSSRRKS